MVVYLSTGESVRLIEVHLSSKCFQEEFTDSLVDHYIGRVSDGSMEFLSELCILCRIEPGNSGKVCRLCWSWHIPFCPGSSTVQIDRQTDRNKNTHKNTSTLVPDIKGSDSRVDAVHSQGQDLCGMGQVWTQLVLSRLCHSHMTFTL